MMLRCLHRAAVGMIVGRLPDSDEQTRRALIRMTQNSSSKLDRLLSDFAGGNKSALARLITLVDVRANQPHLAALSTTGFRTTLEFAHIAIEGRRGERDEIVKQLDEYLTRLVSILEKNANRQVIP